MISIIITILKLLLTLTIVASIHEFGHFLFAKLFHTQVNEFSIGFGPKIVQKKRKETMYSLRWLPLGGYVAIEGEDSESESKNAFNNKNTFQKIVILCAGVAFNAILAIVIFLIISSTYPTYDTTITQFSENSVLENAGLEVGDKILSINGKKVNISADLVDQHFISNKTTEIKYLRNGKENTIQLENAVLSIGYIGVIFKSDAEGNATNEIEVVDSGKSATKAGIKAGDKIVEINGVLTPDASSVKNIVSQNANNIIQVTVDREGEKLTKSLVPESKEQFNLGIDSTSVVKSTPKFAWYKSYSNVSTIVGSYVDLFKGKVKVTDMSGIVGIGEVVSKTNGVAEYFNLLAILSLAIGVANILPFPPLDGGKILIVICEAIFRKKLPIKAEAIISYIGFGLLIVLSLVVTYNDILRVF